MSRKQSEVREHLERELVARDLTAQALMRAAQQELVAAARISREIARLPERKRAEA